ncbi:MAG: VWA domain-containing protein [Myxococcota bacterium]
MTKDPDSPDRLRAATRRRRLLLLSACSLLALGVGLNVHRYAAEAPQHIEADSFEAETRVVQLMEVPPAAEAGESDEAGGRGQRHAGEEGVMGRPTSRSRSGLYAMKGPREATPQLARGAGVLGQLATESGHFLASPYGAAFAVGSDGTDEDVWGSLSPGSDGPTALEAYTSWMRSAFVTTEDDDTSTFSVDVDTAAYTLMRRAVRGEGTWPAPHTVRVEEFINYFDYDYPEPTGGEPVSISTEVGPCPWAQDHRLVKIGLQGRHVAQTEAPVRNLVFLLDVSGSMDGALQLVKASMLALTKQLNPEDRISIVVYAGASGTVLPPTSATDEATIARALHNLEAGGSTNGGEGIQRAYALAEENFVEGGVNRVVLATDGDFNVGVVGHDALVELIEDKRRSGVFLSVLGFGDTHRDATMEQLADKGNGNYAYIDGVMEAHKVLVEQAQGTLQTVAKDVKIQVEFDPDAVERYRLVGYDNRVLADRDFADDTKDAGEIGAGHRVTALYEVIPSGAAATAPLMDLKLRYKNPDRSRSQLLRGVAIDRGVDWDHTSDDFRFAAAVAGFAEQLRHTPAPPTEQPLRELRDLAAGARGADYSCRRAEFVRLVEAAAAAAGETLAPLDLQCVPTAAPPWSPTAVVHAAPTRAGDRGRWGAFILEVLYLLPPLLALPLFVMALRKPRRGRS